MSQKRHEKVLRRKAKMGRRGKQRSEARRQLRIEEHSADLGEVFGSLFTDQVTDTGTIDRLSSEERLNRLHDKSGEAA